MSQSEDQAPVWSPLRLQRNDFLNNLITAVAILFWIRVVLYAFRQEVPRAKFGAIFLGGGILLYVLKQLYELEHDDRLGQVGLIASAVIGTVVPMYVWLNYDVLETTRVGYALGYEYGLAGAFTLAVLYLTYRAFGTAFVSVVILAIAYAYFGAVIPGLMGHSGIASQQIVNVLALEFDGFFGSITQIIATWVALFLLYAGLMRGYGAFSLIMRVSFKTAEYLKSGVAQSAVLSSLIIGSINGAQTANAAMTGSFTIPLMKESGMKSESAGGIEAVASSGGQIMPPVMGAAAFVMASLLDGVGYVDVLIAGLIPAVIFYVSVAVGVHYMASKQLTNQDTDLNTVVADSKEGYSPLIEAIRFGVPFCVLLYTLGIAQWTILSAALYTCGVMIATGVGIPLLLSLVRSSEDVGQTGYRALQNTVSGFKFGAVTVAPIAIIIAAVNGIVDLLNATGMPGKLSLALVSIAGGVMFLTVILSMVICLVLGLGMPTVAAYTIVALLIAPTLTGQFAVPTLSAHFFVLYAAILSGITPPIAIAVVVTSGIAESNFWRTSLEALKLALPLFIIPFSFVYNPEVVAGELTLTTIESGFIILLGAITIIHGLNCAPNPFGITSPLSYLVRALYVVLGVVAMVWPTMVPRLACIAIAVALFAIQTRIIEGADTGSVTKSD